MARTTGARDKGKRKQRNFGEENEKKKARLKAAGLARMAKALQGGSGKHAAKVAAVGAASADDADAQARGGAGGAGPSAEGADAQPQNQTAAAGAGAGANAPREDTGSAADVADEHDAAAELGGAAAELDDGEDFGLAFGVNKSFHTALIKQLKIEARQQQPDWLLKHLRNHDCRIDANAGLLKSIIAKLNTAGHLSDSDARQLQDDVYYIKKVFVWLPERLVDNVGMPPCPYCKDHSRAHVQRHGFRDVGRRVVGEHDTEFVISARYICMACKRGRCRARGAADGGGVPVAARASAPGSGPSPPPPSQAQTAGPSAMQMTPAVALVDGGESGARSGEEAAAAAGGAAAPSPAAAATAAGGAVGGAPSPPPATAPSADASPSSGSDEAELGDEKEWHYTFMGTNEVSLQYHSVGDEFPYILTQKSGIARVVMEGFRALVQKGVRPESYSKILREAHTRKYTRQYIRREKELKREREADAPPLSSIWKRGGPAMFSDFGDRARYAGGVPSGRYLSRVYIKMMSELSEIMAKAVKMRGAEMLHWDVSFKEAGHLARYHGQPIFVGLVTATNEHNEIRVQFHVTADSHEQFERQINEFLDTVEAYGQAMPKLFFTDNPRRDATFVLNSIASVRDFQDELNALTGSDTAVDAALPRYDADPARFVVYEGTASIDNAVKHLHEAFKLMECGDTKRLAVDCEWDSVPRIGSVAVVQLAAIIRPDGVPQAWVLKLGGGGLPRALVDLLADESITLVGRNINADLKKLGKDYNVQCIVDACQHTEDVGMMARRRGVVDHGGVPLDDLVEACLGRTLPKPTHLRRSKWSGKLTQDQIKYAALDALASLDVDSHLLKLPDLNKRLTRAAASIGLEVDIVPAMASLGGRAALGRRAAVGKIVGLDDAEYEVPDGMRPTKGESTTLKAGKTRAVIEIDTVCASHFVIPTIQVRAPRGGDDDGDCVSLGDLAGRVQGDGVAARRRRGSRKVMVLLPFSMLRTHHADADVATLAAGEGIPRAPRSSGGASAAGAAAGAAAAAAAGGSGGPSGSGSGDAEQGAANSSDGGSAAGGGACDELVGVSSSSVGRADTLDEDGECSDLVGDHDDGDELDEQGIAMLRAFKEVLATTPKPGSSARPAPEAQRSGLSPLPQRRVPDRFSAVLGDIFHYMDRTKVPMHHEIKKPFFVALSEAFLIWDDEIMADVCAALRADGLTDAEIEAKRYHDIPWFRLRCPRSSPPPSILYYRVRAVYEFFGHRVDSKSGEPLFNATAWAKADNVLEEITLGYASDPPGVSFYRRITDSQGRVKKDKLGLAYYRNSRGTGQPEHVHKGLAVAVNSWTAGCEMSSYLLQDSRHRYNHRAGERYRPNFPMLGHTDTWLVEVLQALVLDNHNIRLHPGLPSSSAYKSTSEKFDSVPLHSAELQEAIERINIMGTRDDAELSLSESEVLTGRMTQELRYIAKAMRSKLPLVPIDSIQERKAFHSCMATHSGVLDFDAMAVKWCEYVNARTIWPKLPAQLRAYHRRWETNKRIREATRRAATGQAALKALNAASANAFRAMGQPAPPIANHVQLAEAAPIAQTPPGAHQIAGNAVVGPAAVVLQIAAAASGKKKARIRHCKYCRDTLRLGDEAAAACTGKGGVQHCPLFLTPEP